MDTVDLCNSEVRGCWAANYRTWNICLRSFCSTLFYSSLHDLCFSNNTYVPKKGVIKCFNSLLLFMAQTPAGHSVGLHVSHVNFTIHQHCYFEVSFVNDGTPLNM